MATPSVAVNTFFNVSYGHAEEGVANNSGGEGGPLFRANRNRERIPGVLE